MEARIRELCSALLNTKDPDAIQMIGQQLRCAIHDHVEELRHTANDLPIVASMLQAGSTSEGVNTQIRLLPIHFASKSCR